jgi:hypothetical protein
VAWQECVGGGLAEVKEELTDGVQVRAWSAA